MTRPGRPSRTRWPRVLTAALLAVPLLAVPPVATAPPAAAAPPPTAQAPAADDDRPVTVEVTRLEPRTVAPGGTVTVEGTLTNTGTETLTDLTARLQRGEVVTTRADLLVADPEPATVATTAFAPLAARLDAGEEVPFTFTATTADLGLDRDGVYPVLLNVNATGPDGQPSRVGEVSTSVVQQTAPPATATAVAWLWPLVERTHRDASGRFVDDALAAEVSDGGRLDRALAVVERVPEVVAPGATEPAPVAPVTLAVDPVLVEELALMAEGPYDVAGDEDAGTGTDAAAAWLDRLRAVAADHAVVALPYGDVDADALQALELPAALTRSLPGAASRSGTDGGGTDGGTANGGDAAPVVTADSPGPRGVALVAEELGVEPRTDVAWAAGGALRPDTLATLQDGGIEQVVLASGALSGGDAVRGLTGAAAARTTAAGDGGPVTALVADSGLSGLVDAGATSGGVRLAEQRYLAELVLLSQQSVADPAGQTVLVAPPRDVDPDPDGVAAMIADTALPGLRPASLAELAAGPVVDAGTPLEATEPVLLDAAGLADVTSAAGLRDDLAGAVVEDPAAALAPTDAALARTSAVAWRDDPEGFRAAAADLRQTVVGLRQQVTLLAPAEGSYSLASSDAPLVLTVLNDLPFAVRVLVDVRTRDNVGLTIGQVGAQEVASEQRTTLTVPTEVRQSGRFAVSIGLTTPGGGRLGDPVAIQVRSTAYGTISLSITIGAAVLLGLLFLRRGVLFVLRRRRGAVEEDLPADAWPPSRSPV